MFNKLAMEQEYCALEPYMAAQKCLLKALQSS